MVTDLIAFQGYSESEMLQIAASIESLSEHPLAKAIVQKANERALALDRPSELISLTGSGVQAKLGNETWKIGKPTTLDDHLLTEDIASLIHHLEQQGKTVTVMHHSQGVVGVIALQDSIRNETKKAVARLKKLGVKVAMLTGDQTRTAQSIAREAGIDLVYAELLPEDKVNRIKTLKQTYGSVAMVGDGVNDAPALAIATVGIAMGAAGSDAALETADLVLMNDDIEKIASAITLGKRAKAIVKQNIVFAIAVIACLIAANFIQGIALPLGVVGHESSTILVILNGLRLLR
jgi:Cd2+/Zn2+-exporting ATPase